MCVGANVCVWICVQKLVGFQWELRFCAAVKPAQLFACCLRPDLFLSKTACYVLISTKLFQEEFHLFN